MNIRIYACPIVGDGQSHKSAWRAKVADLVDAHTAFIPQKLTGGPLLTWALAICNSSAWTNADSDSTCVRLFSTDLPDTLVTWTQVKNFLQGHTVGQLSTTTRQNLNTWMTNHGISTSGITLATTLWQALGIIITQFEPSFTPDSIAVAA